VALLSQEETGSGCVSHHIYKRHTYIHTYTSEHKHDMCAGKVQTLSAKLGQLQALTKKIFPHGNLPSFWRKCAVFVTNGTSEPKGVLRC
jgi:outer membrane murein-binding lipoprotein Lpp